MEGPIKQYSVTAVSYGRLELHYLHVFPYQCTTTGLAVMNRNSTNFSKGFHSYNVVISVTKFRCKVHKHVPSLTNLNAPNKVTRGFTGTV